MLELSVLAGAFSMGALAIAGRWWYINWQANRKPFTGPGWL